MVETDNSTYSDESFPILHTGYFFIQSNANIRKPATFLTEVQIVKVLKSRKYINCNIASEVLKIYQTTVVFEIKYIQIYLSILKY